MAHDIDLAKLYRGRFADRDLESKYRIWGVLCRHFFQRYVREGDTVLDLGAGYCEFINMIRCCERIALDRNPEVARWAAEGVQVVVADSTAMDPLPDDSVDVVFASNFFEHLPTTDDLLATLREIRRVLRSGGRLLVLQPNIAAIGGRYWDFLDHHLPLTERTLAEACNIVDLVVVEARARLLPYTTKSRLPQHPLLVWLYLKVRPAHWLLGGQAWLVGVKP